MADRTLKDVLDHFTNKDDGILIKWNRTTGDYSVSFQGRPMSYASVEGLIHGILKTLKANTNKDGIVKATLPQPVQKEEDWTPPWES